MTKLVSRGDPLEPGYLNNIRVACAGWSVFSGLAVSQKAAGANMSVDVATGSAIINDVTVTKSSVTNVVVTAAHATYDRYDFVVINSSGTISVIAGTAAATSYAPDYDFETNNAILLAEIYVPATDTAIEDAQITDKRIYANYPVYTHDDGQHTGSAMRGTANGVASLDAGGLVPDAQNAAVNTTHIAAASPHSGNLRYNMGTYTGDNTTNKAIAHGLGGIPKLVIVHQISGAGGFGVKRYDAALWASVYNGGAFALSNTASDATNFYVGSVDVAWYLNTLGSTYGWEAWI